MDIKKMHEWQLASEHKNALANENYEVCQLIKDEINMRIENNTINHILMQGFRNFNSGTQKFYGDPKYIGLNNLFEKYDFNK
jgi:hypothetical protein